MGKFKQHCLEIEKEFGYCLTEKGMTNAQALAFIRLKHGTMAVELCKELLQKWKEEDCDYFKHDSLS